MTKVPSGFTLIELLVSMTLVGFLVVILHVGYRIGVNSSLKAKEGADRAQTIHSTMDLMSRQLASIVPYTSRQKLDQAPVDVLVFQGLEQGVRFVTTFSAESRAAAGLRLVEYWVTSSKDSDGRSLWLTERDLTTDSSLSQSVLRGVSRQDNNMVVADFAGFAVQKDSLLLIDGLESAEFLYVLRPKEDGVPGGNRRGLGQMMSSNRTARLPGGIEVKLHWKEKGLFQLRDFSIVIPVYGGF